MKREEIFVGYDIDGLLSYFVKSFFDWFQEPMPFPIRGWSGNNFINDHFDEIAHDPEFWESIQILNGPETLAIQPDVYITARSISNDISMNWLYDMGYPMVPVYTVGHLADKSAIAKELGVTHFIDDHTKNYHELRAAGIECYLYKPYYLVEETPDIPIEHTIYNIEDFNNELLGIDD